MVSYPNEKEFFGDKLVEGSIITAVADIENNFFEIKDESDKIFYRSNAKLKGTTWRFAIWWVDSTVRIRIL